MAGFLLAPCGNVHLVEMYKQGKQDADMRVRKNTVGYVWRGNGLSAVSYTHLDVYKRQKEMCGPC